MSRGDTVTYIVTLFFSTLVYLMLTVLMMQILIAIVVLQDLVYCRCCSNRRSKFSCYRNG